MPVNASPEYAKAEKEYLEAKTIEDQIAALDTMLKVAPKHKSSENLLANLRTRKKRLEADIVKRRKAGKSKQVGIKKGDMQVVIVGKTNSGKSSLLTLLTNAAPKTNSSRFTTTQPQIGILDYNGTQIQVVEIPAINGEHFDKGIVHTTDTIIILVNELSEIKEIENLLPSNLAKNIICFNKIDLLEEEQKRKLSATLQSKKYNFVLISTIKGWQDNGIEELKEKIFNSFHVLRIFTKEPGKEKSNRAMIMKPHSTVKDVAEKILKGFSTKIKETRIWGPSSKFGGQIVGLNHQLKDLDVVEFKTK